MKGLTTRVRHVLKSDPACCPSPTRTVLRVLQLEGADIPDEVISQCGEFSKPGDIERTMRRLQRLGLYLPKEDSEGDENG